MNANDGISVNSKYKDRLFRFIFGAEENKKYLLSLYNAVNGTDYTNVEDIEITTLEDVIYIKMKNDISFIFDSELTLYEHQSTYNPNMPLRGLMYFSDLYRQWLSRKKTDLYGSTLVKIPTPNYIVFYNGTRKCHDKEIIRLSDAFEKEDTSGHYEWTATMLNINEGHNKELMEKCLSLQQYASYVGKVKKYSKQMPIEQAVAKAVAEAINENYLDGFFKKHREGVVNMSLTEFNEEEFVANRRAEGEAIGMIKAYASLVKDGILSLAEAAKRANMSEEDFKKNLL